MAEEVKYPKYRWFLLFMAWALLCLTSYNNTMQNVRYDLREAAPIGLGLTTTEFYLCITASALAPVVVNFLSGLLTDRIGAKRVILYGAIITVFGAMLRVAATGFIDLFIYCIIMGVGLGTLSGNVPKIVGQWFPVRQVYLGIALFSTSLGIGPFLALATGAMFSSYFVGFLVMGGSLAAMCVVWGMWAKDRPREYLEDGKPIIGVSFKESLLTVVKSKPLWLILLSYALVAGVVASWVGGIPLFLVMTKGVSASLAGVVISLSVVGYTIGIVLWAWVAEKVGRMKPVFAVCMALSGTTGLLTYILAPGIGMWVLGIFPGLFMGAGPPLVMQMPLRLKGIGTRYAGAAVGLITSFSALMAFVMLPYMFTPLWNTFNPIYAAVFLCVCLWVAGGLFILAPEVGRKYIMRVLQEAQGAGATAS